MKRRGKRSSFGDVCQLANVKKNPCGKAAVRACLAGIGMLVSLRLDPEIDVLNSSVLQFQSRMSHSHLQDTYQSAFLKTLATSSSAAS